ncbi:hypothetical protein DRE_04238 [Drechslerella stenobrocha 248]|uniref:DNA repair protein rhp26 n=1 Tax=Drechslerella stenobrocha 248 TaxID=1043628 RepID=W7IBT1_9PEZI|nr:hypothetical protein DRE_04238 [Drechslerella stenobrocha 248]
MDEELNVEAELGLQAFAHESLEGMVAEKAEANLLEKELKQSDKLKEKEASSIRKLEQEIKGLESLIRSSFGVKKTKWQEKLAEAKAKIDVHNANIVDIDQRLVDSAAKAAASIEAVASRDQRQGESRRDYLIRRGIINPFSKAGSFGTGGLEEGGDQLSFQHLRAPGFAADEPARPTGLKRQRVARDREVTTVPDLPPSPGRKTPVPVDRKVVGFEDDYEQGARTTRLRRAARQTPARNVEAIQDASETPEEESDEYHDEGEVEDVEEGGEGDGEEEAPAAGRKGKGKKAAKKRRRDEDESAGEEEEDMREYDDGYENVYQKRIKEWCAKRSAARPDGEQGEEGIPEWFKPSPSSPDLVVDDGFKVPGDIGQSLFDYQKTAVSWLWELHAKQQTGGILGDEMGLGKTIQAIAFVAGLHYSKLLTKPVLVVAPATVLRQWCNEFHKWWPALRVSILHSSGSGMLSVATDERAEERLDEEEDILDAIENRAPTKAQKAAKKIVDKVKAKGHVLISTYSGLTTYQKLLLETEWECVILDEGHRIRNPEAKITMAAKQLLSPTRFILSGTPIQNNLKELWSLFDFVYPGKLGVFGVFNEHIATPIKLGGYAGASNLEIHAAFKCAVVLREMIGPYILRRLKADVAVLPPKQDQVLFCNLVKQQKEAYEAFIKSNEAEAIFSGKRDMLAGIDVLRKICNHPDLCDRVRLITKPEYNYGNPLLSGKMQIVKGLLKAWEKDKLKCLIFSQGVQMLDILEKFVKNLGFSSIRLDGSTDIRARQAMVDQFNTDPTLQVFLLTTKVGGYGLNLTGATRIIIFDPDWNPSNDMQARERSWRLGQKHEVRIYRLLSRGTIEEKIYQRQLYKQFLTKKILEDPEQRRVFRMDDMQDLFTFGSLDHGTETGSLFEGVERTLSVAKKIVEDQQSKQVESIAGVDRIENFVGGPNNMLSGSMGEGSAKVDSSAKDGNKEKNGKGKTVPQDDHLLDSILAKAGVHSIVQHDAIMSTSKSSSDVIEREANRVAAVAKAALKRSFETIKQYSVTGTRTSTWTGKKLASDGPGKELTRTQMKPAFRKWFSQQMGRVTTQMILDHFNPMLSKKLAPDFKVMLNENAQRAPGSSYWTLKPLRGRREQASWRKRKSRDPNDQEGASRKRRRPREDREQDGVGERGGGANEEDESGEHRGRSTNREERPSGKRKSAGDDQAKQVNKRKNKGPDDQDHASTKRERSAESWSQDSVRERWEDDANEGDESEEHRGSCNIQGEGLSRKRKNTRCDQPRQTKGRRRAIVLDGTDESDG